MLKNEEQRPIFALNPYNFGLGAKNAILSWQNERNSLYLQQPISIQISMVHLVSANRWWHNSGFLIVG